MSGRGSTANVIAALASFFIPGLGQLIQGRILAALLFFVLSGVLWIFLLGWLGHVVAAVEAAVWKGP
jgi:TM2 domain-containing membrane protein YozV